MNVAEVEEQPTVPGTGDPSLKVKLAEVTDAQFKVSLKAIFNIPFTLNPEDAFKGFVTETSGGVESGAEPVVKLHKKVEAIEFPAKSRTAVVTVAA